LYFFAALENRKVALIKGEKHQGEEEKRRKKGLKHSNIWFLQQLKLLPRALDILYIIVVGVVNLSECTILSSLSVIRKENGRESSLFTGFLAG